MANNDVIKKVKKFIKDESLLAFGDTVILGVSGGADSVCLLKIMSEIRTEYGLRLICVSINHGLRPEAKCEQDYVGKLCEDYDIEFVPKDVDVKKLSEDKGLGTEEAARILRYEAFEDVASDYPDAKVAIAHNKNDVSETFLFNLFRGTGPKGLGAMRPKRDRYIRPLLAVERREIEEYLSSEGIMFYTDSSNLTDDYSRNKIRHHILEYASDEINSRSVSHIADTANMIRRLNDIIEKMAEDILSEATISVTKKELLIKRDSLESVDPFVANLVIKKCIDILVLNNKDITSTHLDSVRGLMKDSEMKMLDLPYGIRVTASGGKVRFIKGEDETIDVVVPISGEQGEIRIPTLGTVSWHLETKTDDFVIPEKKYTKCFDYDKISQSLCLRYGVSEDYITVNDKLQKKKLFDYLRNEKLPVFERKKTFVLADGNRIWWVIGYRIGELAKVRDNTKNILYVEVRKED